MGCSRSPTGGHTGGIPPGCGIKHGAGIDRGAQTHPGTPKDSAQAGGAGSVIAAQAITVLVVTGVADAPWHAVGTAQAECARSATAAQAIRILTSAGCLAV